MYKKSAFLFSCIFVAFIVISCNSCKNKPASVETPKAPPPVNGPPINITSTLDVLSLTTQQLQTLLNGVTSGTVDDKIIFQFFYDQNGTLNLKAWPKHAGSRHFDYNTAISLTEDGVSNTVITNQNVHLGNLRLDPGEYSLLLDNSTKFAYFIFIPSIKQVETNDTFYYIVYDIYGTNTDPTSIEYPLAPTVPKNATFITGTKNPSPPY